jgi:hypothetical protein
MCRAYITKDAVSAEILLGIKKKTGRAASWPGPGRDGLHLSLASPATRDVPLFDRLPSSAPGELVKQRINVSDDFVTAARVVRQDSGQIVPSQVPYSTAHDLCDVLIEGNDERCIVHI